MTMQDGQSLNLSAQDSQCLNMTAQDNQCLNIIAQDNKCLSMTAQESQHLNVADISSHDTDFCNEVGLSRKRRTALRSDTDTICNKKICLERDSCQCLKTDADMHSPTSLDRLEHMVADHHNNQPSTSRYKAKLDEQTSSPTMAASMAVNMSSNHRDDCKMNHQRENVGGIIGPTIAAIMDKISETSSDSDSDMEMMEPAFSHDTQNESGETEGEESGSDGQMFIRWHNRHVAKAIVDNAINKTIEEMGLGPSPPPGVETHQRQVEDQGVSEAIRQWGLRRQSPFYASHLSPIINRLTEVSENLFSRTLYRPVVSRNNRLPQPSTSSSAIAHVDLDSTLSPTQLISSDLKASQESFTNSSNDHDDSVTSLSHHGNSDVSDQSDCVSVCQPESPNRSDILDEAVTVALSQSGLACTLFDQQSP